MFDSIREEPPKPDEEGCIFCHEDLGEEGPPMVNAWVSAQPNAPKFQAHTTCFCVGLAEGYTLLEEYLMRFFDGS